jgi:hypothetical protein
MESPSLSALHSIVDLMVKSLRQIAKSALDSDENQQNSTLILRRVVRIYSKPYFRKLVDVPKELLFLIKHKAEDATSRLMSYPKAMTFIEFLVDEAFPSDLLKALTLGEKYPIHQPELLPFLNKVLIRGALLGSELSVSLLRIKRARQRLEQPESSSTTNNNIDQPPKWGIWTSMASGVLNIDK